MDWILSFPISGNEGRKYLYYSISFVDRKNGNFQAQISLGDIFENPKFEENLPHTIGFFRESRNTDANASLTYLEIRLIRSIEEFWKYLNDLDL